MQAEQLTLRGMYRDILMNGNLILFDSRWVPNTIVHRGRILLAAFFKNDPSDGIQSLAVGQGSPAWDTDGPPPPDASATTGLESRYTPVIPISRLNVVYLDDGHEVVTGPTSRLQITSILEPGYPAPLPSLTSYPLREFGLFGRLNGTEYMINCIRHPVIHKDESATLIRAIRLYF